MSKLIKKEDITKIQSDICNISVDTENYTLEPYAYGNRQSIYIDSISIVNYDNKPMLCLAEGVDKKYMSEWRKDVGSLLTKDILKQKIDRLYEFITPEYKALLRKASEDELDNLKECDFLHIKFVDSYYTILRIVNINESFRSKPQNIIEYTEPSTSEDQDDADDYKYVEEPAEDIESMSLFE